MAGYRGKKMLELVGIRIIASSNGFIHPERAKLLPSKIFQDNNPDHELPVIQAQASPLP